MQDWVKDLKKSAQAFEAIKHTIMPKIISGTIVSIETTDNEVLGWLDKHSGIDLLRKDAHGLQGIAWRAQWGHAYDSFTIRLERHTGAKTELEKRIEAIEKAYFYPVFTVQAYFDKTETNNCLSIGAIRTIDLYEVYKNEKHKFKDKKSDNKFLFIEWKELPGLVKVWRSQQGQLDIFQV